MNNERGTISIFTMHSDDPPSLFTSYVSTLITMNSDDPSSLFISYVYTCTLITIHSIDPSPFFQVLWTCVWCISWLKYLTRIYIDFHLPRYKPILINNGNNRIYFIDYCKIWYKQKYINKNLTHGNINWNNL